MFMGGDMETTEEHSVLFVIGSALVGPSGSGDGVLLHRDNSKMNG